MQITHSHRRFKRSTYSFLPKNLYFGDVYWATQTVREVLHRWKKLGMEGLWEKPGRGGKPRWAEADMVFLEECLEKELRTYNSVQLAQKLEQERSIT